MKQIEVYGNQLCTKVPYIVKRFESDVDTSKQDGLILISCKQEQKNIIAKCAKDLDNALGIRNQCRISTCLFIF